MVRSTALAALALLVLALPAVAAGPPIRAGIDSFMTVPEGTFADFQLEPLPAGFFCTSSPAFTGRIWLRGVPLASDNPRFAKTDTIIQRLDNAVFNSRGVATTRFQIKALQLEGIQTFKSVCGEYRVQVTLEGEQPITTMRIVRENKDGGRFAVKLKINTKMIFTRVDNPSERLEFSRAVTFEPSPYHRWGYRDLRNDSKRAGEFMVDTDWDGTPDTFVPGASNFAAGRGSRTKFQQGESIQHDSSCAHLVMEN